jgi:hypothetical protein
MDLHSYSTGDETDLVLSRSLSYAFSHLTYHLYYADRQHRQRLFELSKNGFLRLKARSLRNYGAVLSDLELIERAAYEDMECHEENRIESAVNLIQHLALHQQIQLEVSNTVSSGEVFLNLLQDPTYLESALEQVAVHTEPVERFWATVLLAEVCLERNYDDAIVSSFVTDALNLSIPKYAGRGLGELGVSHFERTVATLARCLTADKTLLLLRKGLNKAHHASLLRVVSYLRPEDTDTAVYLLRQGASQVVTCIASLLRKQEFLAQAVLTLLRFDHHESLLMLMRYLQVSGEMDKWGDCKYLFRNAYSSSEISERLAQIVGGLFGPQSRSARVQQVNEIIDSSWAESIDNVQYCHLYIFGKAILSGELSMEDAKCLVSQRLAPDPKKSFLGQRKTERTAWRFYGDLERGQWGRYPWRYDYEREDEKEVRWELRRLAKAGILDYDSTLVTISRMRIPDLAADCAMILLSALEKDQTEERHLLILERLLKIAQGRGWMDWAEAVRKILAMYVAIAGVDGTLVLATRYGDESFRRSLYASVADWMMDNGSSPDQWMSLIREAQRRNVPLGVILRQFIQGLANSYGWNSELTLLNSSFESISISGWLD